MNNFDLTAEEILEKLDGDVHRLRAKPRDRDYDLPSFDHLGSLNDKWNLPPSHRKGPIKRFADFALRKLFLVVKNFMGGIVSSQESYNEKVASQFATVTESIKLESERVDSEVSDLRESIAAVVAKDDVSIDYFKFENKFRGSEEKIMEMQRKYLKYFEGVENVLDIGCGRGEFLRLLKEKGISSKGIDINATFVDHCIKANSNVEFVDANSYLIGLEDDSLDGITAFQVIEHLDKKYLIDLITLCYKKLKKGACLVFETPNPKALSVFVNSFYIDLSHKNPIHPQALLFLMESQGFTEAEIAYTSFVKGDDMLKYGDIDDEAYRKNVDMLNNILYGPQDYAVIVRK